MKTSFSRITKINPVSWRELLIFCPPKLQHFCLSIRKSVCLPLWKYHVPTNWQRCRCGGTFLWCFVFAIRISSYVVPRLVPRPAWSYEEPPCYIYISAWAVQLWKAADFSIVLQGKQPRYNLKSFFKPWQPRTLSEGLTYMMIVPPQYSNTRWWTMFMLNMLMLSAVHSHVI